MQVLEFDLIRIPLMLRLFGRYEYNNIVRSGKRDLAAPLTWSISTALLCLPSAPVLAILHTFTAFCSSQQLIPHNQQASRYD